MPVTFAAARLIMASFFVYSGSTANWMIRIPDIQTKLGLDPATLALCLLGMPVGLATSMLFSGALVDWLGARRAIQVGFVAMMVPLALPAFAPNAPLLFVALVIVGLGMGPLEVGLNVMADRIGGALGRTVMSRCHGFWSLGVMAGGATGSAAATFGIGPEPHMLAVVTAVVVLGQIFALMLPDMRDAPRVGPKEKTPVFVLPSRSLVALCFFAFGMLVVEGAIIDWSAIYLRDDFGAVPPVTGYALTAFAAVMAAGRLGGDWMSTRFGPVATARLCSAVAVAGVAAMVASPYVWLVVAGAAATGFGVSVAFPLAVSSAASREGRPGVNVAALSILSFSGFLIGPPVIGFVAHFSGFRFGLATLLIPAVASLLLAGEVRVRRAARAGTLAGGAAAPAR